MNMERIAMLLLILGLLCILYGGAVYLAASGTGFFAVWLGGGLICLLLARLTQRHLWSAIPLWVRATGTLLCGILLLALLLAEGCILRSFSSRGMEHLSCLIVLGAQVREDGPSKVLTDRLDTAAAYLRENPDTLCIVSGGQGFNEPATEASQMKAYLMEQGIEESRMIAEERSRNTNENIAYSMKLLNRTDVPIGIVTNNFHVFRAVAICKKKGLAGAVGIAAPSTPFYLPNNLLREGLGVIKDKLRGNL